MATTSISIMNILTHVYINILAKGAVGWSQRSSVASCPARIGHAWRVFQHC